MLCHKNTQETAIRKLSAGAHAAQEAAERAARAARAVTRSVEAPGDSLRVLSYDMWGLMFSWRVRLEFMAVRILQEQPGIVFVRNVVAGLVGVATS